jgi:hypothetical protein
MSGNHPAGSNSNHKKGISWFKLTQHIYPRTPRHCLIARAATLLAGCRTTNKSKEEAMDRNREIMICFDAAAEFLKL